MGERQTGTLPIREPKATGSGTLAWVPALANGAGCVSALSIVANVPHPDQALKFLCLPLAFLAFGLLFGLFAMIASAIQHTMEQDRQFFQQSYAMFVQQEKDAALLPSSLPQLEFYRILNPQEGAAEAHLRSMFLSTLERQGEIYQAAESARTAIEPKIAGLTARLPNVRKRVLLFSTISVLSASTCLLFIILAPQFGWNVQQDLLDPPSPSIVFNQSVLSSNDPNSVASHTHKSRKLERLR